MCHRFAGSHHSAIPLTGVLTTHTSPIAISTISTTKHTPQFTYCLILNFRKDSLALRNDSCFATNIDIVVYSPRVSPVDCHLWYLPDLGPLHRQPGISASCTTCKKHRLSLFIISFPIIVCLLLLTCLPCVYCAPAIKSLSGFI